MSGLNVFHGSAPHNPGDEAGDRTHDSLTGWGKRWGRIVEKSGCIHRMGYLQVIGVNDSQALVVRDSGLGYSHGWQESGLTVVKLPSVQMMTISSGVWPANGLWSDVQPSTVPIAPVAASKT